MAALMEMQGLSKGFGGMLAVDDVHLTLDEGAVTGIIGPNGAGKTTLIHLLTGHLLPDDGTIRLDGEDITGLPAHERVRRRLCRTFQIVDIFAGLTVFENVQLAIITRHRRNLRFLSPAHAESREEVERALKEVGMWDFRDRKGEALSHGQQRRLELAVTLATEPRLCFLDEPTSGVSPQERDQMLALIKDLAGRRRTTFILVEHDMEVVFDLCRRVVVMHFGRVLADGTPDEIRTDQAVQDVYLGDEV